MPYYPLFLDIAGRRCVVVGGGSVAERKIARLLECGAEVEVLSPLLTEVLAELKKEGRIVHHGACYEEAWLRGAFLVIGATDDPEVNRRVAADARKLGILVCVVDSPEVSDFIVPALCRRGDLAIAVSTGGKSPALSARIRRELESAYGPEYAVLAEILGELRKTLPGRGGAADAISVFLSSDIIGLIRGRRWKEIESLIEGITGVRMEVGGDDSCGPF